MRLMGCTLTLWLVQVFFCSVQAAQKPNILLAIADDQSYPHTSIYGTAGVKTPAFDRVAREGVLFKNAFVQSPGCSPSRAALLTGRYPWQVEHAGTHASYFSTKYVVYPDILENEGYFVGFTGKGWGPGDWASSGRTRNPAGPEFNERTLDPPANGISNIDYVGNFEEFLEERPAESPFCFWYGGKEPHRSYEEGSGLAKGKTLEEASVPGFLPDVEEIRSDLLDYYLEVEWFDLHLAKMLQILERRGELDNTIIVVTADNGLPFPRAKANLYESGFHVPLAVRWGDRVPGGRVVDDLVGLVDLAPTFLDATGTEHRSPFPMSGRSLLRILRSKRDGLVDSSRTEVYSGRERHSSSRYNNLGYPHRTLRTHDFLYIRNFEPDLWPAGAPQKYNDDGSLGPNHGAYQDIDASPSLSLLVEGRDDPKIKPFFELAVGKRPAEELYDIRTDPGCVENLVEKEDFEEVRQVMGRRLSAFLKRTGDARLVGDPEVFRSYIRISNSRRFPSPSDEDAKPIQPVKQQELRPQPIEPQKTVLIELEAGQYDRKDTPVFFSLPKDLQSYKVFTLSREESGATVDAQLMADGQPRLVWIIKRPLNAGQTRRYRLNAFEGFATENDVVRASSTNGKITLKVGEYPVLGYNEAINESPSGLAAYYRRSGYIHPLYNPFGQEVTGDFAPDHAHQHGLFMAWVNTTFEGRPVDFWNQTKQQGEIRHVETEERVSGPVFGQFTVSLSYSDTSAPVRPREVLEETWTVRVYNVTSSYMFDVLSQQKCVQDMPLKINKYHYGGMALRGPSQWFDPNGSKTNKAITSADDPDQELRSVHFLTSEGKGWFDGNHTNARWVDMYGKVDGRESGVLVMGHPENFRAPQMVRLNPNKPYFCFAPMVTDAFEIKPGDTYTSRYRYWIHTGSPDSNTSDRLWTDYAYPPKARMVDR